MRLESSVLLAPARDPIPLKIAKPMTDQQGAFYDAIDDNKNGLDILLSARAGTGKSSSCEQAQQFSIEAEPARRIKYACFNKAIADEFRVRAPSGVDVGTMHSFGYRQLRERFASKVEKNKTYLLLNEIPALRRFAHSTDRKPLVKLVSACKNAAVDLRYRTANDFDDILKIGDDLGILVGVIDRQSIAEAAVLLLVESLKTVSFVDFDDMLWMPTMLSMRFAPCDDLYIDECLPAWTPILLADGTSKSIGEIVDGELPVEVLSYDTQEGCQKPCKVTRWSRTFNRKPLVKIRVQWTRKKETNRPTNFVVCTTDHKVWADGEWIPAGDVLPGMVMQVETSAEKSQFGKITSKGRRVLAGSISGRNESGEMKSERDHSRSFSKRGGNGQGPTLAQSVLCEALGDGWKMEHVIATGRRSEGFPHCYKIDIAHPDEMIAIEVDGSTHYGSRREQDRRKDEFLRSLGWKVIRVSNRSAIQETDEVVSRILASDCPIGARVLSVEPIDIPDSYVYDIAVEECHNFYANGILVHNCQDLNPIQLKMLDVICPNGRLVMVGDPYQSIYAFRGAVDAIDRLTSIRQPKTLPLTISFRCPRLVGELARRLVPDFETMPSAKVGSIGESRDPSERIAHLQPGDFVLSRLNAPLVSACLNLIGLGQAATMRGRAIGDSLMDFAHTAGLGQVHDMDHFRHRLADFFEREKSFLMKREGAEDLIESLTDRVSCLQAICSRVDSPSSLHNAINSLFDDAADPSKCVTFSSIHRSKGSEADRVILLDAQTKRNDEMTQQERNLKYVALTRSKQHFEFLSATRSLDEWIGA